MDPESITEDMLIRPLFRKTIGMPDNVKEKFNLEYLDFNI
jgi:hypothetical protein